jgi:O-methyltransferase involved in polyketide biosynthesis
MALFRALETARPARDRLFTDRYARHCLRGGLRLVAEAARLPPARRALEWVIDRRWPGPRSSAVVRTRVIDDAVEEAVAAGARQLVVLGAGFDCRAHRLTAATDLVAYEVDLPATTHVRAQRLRRLGTDVGTGVGARSGAGPHVRTGARVRPVPADLAREPVDEVLLAAGFDPRTPAVVLWEGVTNYLSAAAVDATLRGLARVLCAGSWLVLTYVDAAALSAASPFPEAARWRGRVAAAGESFTFGLDPAQAPAFLRDRGFAATDHVSTAQAAGRFARAGRREPGSALYRVVTARRSPGREAAGPT